MSEYYYSPHSPDDGRIVIVGPEARHISLVMRHRPGDRVTVVDGAGNEYGVELVTTHPTRVVGRVVFAAKGRREPQHQLTLAMAVLKGDRLALACEQATELGISRFIPLRTERTIGRLSGVRLERLRAVALAAMKSCARAVLPIIEPPHDIARLITRMAEFDQALVAYEEEECKTGLGDVLDSRIRSLLLVVGPEGGFTPEEVQVLKSAGVSPFSLGPRRLRAETAATAVVSSALQLLGDLGGQSVRQDAMKGGANEAWSVLP